MSNIPTINLYNSTKMTNFLECMSAIKDPRIKKKTKHSLTNLIVIMVFAVLAGANTASSIARFGVLHIDWFRTILQIGNKMPSHDTFNRILKYIDPIDLGFWLGYWLSESPKTNDLKHIAIDGKEDNANQFYCLRAFDVNNKRVIAYVPIPAGSNEITAAKIMLSQLDMKGAIITGDAIFAQKQLAKMVIDAGGDYLFTLKGNQHQFHKDVKLYLDDIEENEDLISTFDKSTTYDKDHGRGEKRICITTNKTNWLYQKNQWKSLRTISSIESFRSIKGNTATSKRYYISSLDASSEKIGSLSRQHWSIENHCHNALDTVFDSDRTTFRDKTACLNLATIKDFVLALLKNSNSKDTIQQQRLTNAFQLESLIKTLCFS